MAGILYPIPTSSVLESRSTDVSKRSGICSGGLATWNINYVCDGVSLSVGPGTVAISNIVKRIRRELIAAICAKGCNGLSVIG